MELVIESILIITLSFNQFRYEVKYYLEDIKSLIYDVLKS